MKSSTAIATLLLTLATLTGCQEKSKAKDNAPRQASSVTSSASPVVARVSPAAERGSSIYSLHVNVRDQSGAAATFDMFRGEPAVIVSMFFGACPAACPLLVTHIKQIESSLAPDLRSQVRVLLVSFDPENDTPLALRDLARAHKVDNRPYWRFASATSDDEARVLGNALGINFQRLENGMFSHDSALIVLDREGRIAARSESSDLSADVGRLSSAITQLLHGSI